MLKKLIIWSIIIGVFTGLLAYGAIFIYLPSQDPHNEMTKDAILNTLKSETVVLYEDEDNQLGAFFSKEHRRYADYATIPQHIVQGLIAGEDQNYFSHEGFDPKGFGRALFKTITTGKKQGGSTLTQQAAKNLFSLYDRTLTRKVKELIYAKRLEYYFTKEQILEFYLNQFYVSGTGRGVAIAAKYFFNKTLDQLTLRECAFIAGSVKGPSNYDPFIKRTQERKNTALTRGVHRTNYILNRMSTEGYISETERLQAVNDTLAFDKGNFKSALSTPMSWVYQQLQSEEMQKILIDEGLVPWEESQLTIITTLRKDLQDGLVHSNKKNLSRLETLINGYKKPSREKPSKYSYTTPGEFGYGKVEQIERSTKGSITKVHISMGQVQGTIEKKELKKWALKQASHKYGRTWSLSSKRYNTLINPLIKSGAILYLRTINTPQGLDDAQYSIEQEPTIEGASYLLHQGKIQGVSNGFRNRGYDRISRANRQFGSSWKPLLYATALENGWGYMDLLENENNVFQYSTSFYFPNPDHKKRGNQVSLTWAATRSENIASIYLLTHLLDKLPSGKFWNQAKRFRFTPASDESDNAYYERLRDSLGLHLNKKANLEMRFAKAKEQLMTELAFLEDMDQIQFVKQMQCGHGFKKQYAKQKNPTTKKFLLNNFLYHTAALNGIDKRPIYYNDSLNRYGSFLRKPDAPWKALPKETIYPTLDSLYINGGIQKTYLDSLVRLIGSPLKKNEMIQPENLRYFPDFNTSLSMEVYIDFCKRVGITQSLEKVLSLPLGANDIHLSEITHAYETILSGKQYKGLLNEWGEGVLIEKIYNNAGEIIFENDIQERHVLNDTLVSQMTIMLRSVIENGTGRFANRTVSLKNPESDEKFQYPLYGKTGTTNSFRNAAFLGGLAGWDDSADGFTPYAGYTLGSYVGFDNNKPMISRALKVSGASGPLPQWADMANVIITADSVHKNVDFLDFELLISNKITPINSLWGIQKAVDPLTGIFNTTDKGSNTLPYIYTIKD
ncbi:MAG: transglycosylase domain-containing protein [Fibrobacterales bacterium]